MCRYYYSDAEVSSDHELQDFANEVSAEGTYGPYGSKGEVSWAWHEFFFAIRK